MEIQKDKLEDQLLNATGEKVLAEIAYEGALTIIEIKIAPK